MYAHVPVCAQAPFLAVAGSAGGSLTTSRAPCDVETIGMTNPIILLVIQCIDFLRTTYIHVISIIGEYECVCVYTRISVGTCTYV